MYSFNSLIVILSVKPSPKVPSGLIGPDTPREWNSLTLDGIFFAALGLDLVLDLGLDF